MLYNDTAVDVVITNVPGHFRLPALAYTEDFEGGSGGWTSEVPTVHGNWATLLHSIIGDGPPPGTPVGIQRTAGPLLSM